MKKLTYQDKEGNNVTINEKVVKNLIKTIKPGLSCGLGKPKPGQMCVEAAVCYAMGMDHNDQPECVAPAVRDAKIALNDMKDWPSKKARAQGLLKVAIAQLGSDRVIKDFNNDFERELSRQLARLIFASLLNNDKTYDDAIKFFKYGVDDSAEGMFEYLPKGHKYLLLAAEALLNTLKKFKSPGCRYLYLVK
jgi:hypothetical protein